jgi:GT2 family glycosyltransferase
MLSIITPNLNNAKYIEDNIKSIMSLSIPYEHIIVDGGSTDGSLEIISKYKHIKLLQQTEKTGMYGAIHMGFLASKGEFITWVNSDDRVIPSGLEKIYNTAFYGKYDFTYSNGNYLFINDNHIEFGKGRRFGKFFLKHGIIPAIQPSIIFSKKIYNNVGGLNYNNFKICGDLDLFVKIAKNKDSKFRYLPVLSTIFIKRGDSLGDLNNDLYLRELKENNLPTPNLIVRALFFACKFI